MRASPSLANGGGAPALRLKIWLASLSEWDIRSLRVEEIDGEGYVGSNPTARTKPNFHVRACVEPSRQRP